MGMGPSAGLDSRPFLIEPDVSRLSSNGLGAGQESFSLPAFFRLALLVRRLMVSPTLR